MGGLEIIDPRYRALYESALDVLGRDQRVIGVEVSGSVGAGTADRWSDLDLHIVVEPDRYEEFLASWPEWLAAVTPTVFASAPIMPFIINTVTDDGLTLDVVIFSGQAPPPFTPPPQYSVGMLSSQRFDNVGDALEYAVAEQMRGMAGPFVSLVQRDEHLRHLAGVPHILGLLTTVFLAETGAPPPGKHWNLTFTDEQRAAAATLPPVAANREAIIAFGLGVAELGITRARPLYPRYDLEWPSALAAVVADRLRTELDIDTSGWLY